MSTVSDTIIKDYYAAWKPGNQDAILGFFTNDAAFEDFAFQARFDGRDQILSFITMTYAGIPDFRVVPTQIVVGTGGAAARWLMTGTHAGDLPGLPATGKRFEVHASSVIEMEGPLICGMFDYWNPDAFRACVGLI